MSSCNQDRGYHGGIRQITLERNHTVEARETYIGGKKIKYIKLHY